MTDGIKGPDSSGKTEHSSMEPLMKLGSDKQKEIEAMSTPVRTLGELKSVLLKSLGKEKGTKLYNHFLMGIVQSMLSDVRQAAQRADQAAKDMNQPPP